MPHPSTPKSVLFLISEDWFFASHFLPLAAAVQAAGYAVSVHTQIGDPGLRTRFEALGIRVIPSTNQRKRLGFAASLAEIRRLVGVFRRERPTILHVMSLRVVLLGGIAARLARVPIRVHALTGMGLLGATRGWRSRLLFGALGFALRHGLGGRGAAYVFENRQDPERLGMEPGRPGVLVVGGAGVDPDRESELPFPDGPSLKVAIVSRMIFSKGIGVAVRAVQEARLAGADVTLTLVGAPDPGNPRSLTTDQLQRWSGLAGITWAGRSDDVNAVWRTHHVVCVPSLGGEGLPRALLEGAAAGRPIVTTRTPGCATFVRDDVEGLLVPPGDAAALATAFVALAADPDRVRRLGAAARARVLDGFTTRAVSRAILDLYDELAAT